MVWMMLFLMNPGSRTSKKSMVFVCWERFLVDGLCQFCGINNETVYLMSFLSVNLSKRVWNLIALNGGDKQTWLELIKDWNGKQLLGLYMFIGWNLWNNRDRCLHNHKCLTSSINVIHFEYKAP